MTVLYKRKKKRPYFSLIVMIHLEVCFPANNDRPAFSAWVLIIGIWEENFIRRSNITEQILKKFILNQNQSVYKVIRVNVFHLTFNNFLCMDIDHNIERRPDEKITLG